MAADKSGWGKAAAAAAFGVLLLLLAEGLARLFHEPAPVRRVYDPFAHRIPQPGLVDTFAGVDGERVTVRLNELGMRGPAAAADAGTLTLVFLGGSTTEGYAYELEATFPELIARELERRGRGAVRAFNAGMSGATTGTSLGRLQHQVLDLGPDLVVVMHGINDLVWGFHPAFRADGRHLPRPPAADARPRSYLLDWLRRRRWLWPREDPPVPDYELRDFAEFPARRVFARNLRSMAAIARAHAVPIVFLTQPTMYGKTPDSERFVMTRTLAGTGRVPDVATLARGMEAMNATTREVAASFEDGVYVVDLAAVLPRTWDLFYDECHFTRLGNARVASELAPALEDAVAGNSFRSEIGRPKEVK
jgi:lysophospholipase L1-like esterase